MNATTATAAPATCDASACHCTYDVQPVTVLHGNGDTTHRLLCAKDRKALAAMHDNGFTHARMI